MRTTPRPNEPGISKPVIALAAGALVTGFLLSCRGDGVGVNEVGEVPTNSFFQDRIQKIFTENCISCHNPDGVGFTTTGGEAANGLDLREGVSYDNLVNQPTFEFPQVRPLLRVDPSDPENSYLIEKITTAKPKSGSQMPQGLPPLAPAEIRDIRSWIAAGAPREGLITVDTTDTIPPVAEDSTIVYTEEQKRAILDMLDKPYLTPPEIDSIRRILADPPWGNVVVEPIKKIPAEVWQIFDELCTLCHNFADQANGCFETGTESLEFSDCLGLETPEIAYARLVGTPTYELPGEPPLVRVVPGDTAASYLWQKLDCDQVDDPPKEGGCMPLKGEILDEELEVIKQWILAGAPSE